MTTRSGAHRIRHNRLRKSLYILQVSKVANPSPPASAEIVVEHEQLPAVRADEFYWTDLEGLEVRTTTGLVLGRVDHLLATGANDVLVLGGSPEVLIPFILGPVVKQVDLATGLIVVDWSPDY